jgi:hypothetical protein
MNREAYERYAAGVRDCIMSYFETRQAQKG